MRPLRPFVVAVLLLSTTSAIADYALHPASPASWEAAKAAQTPKNELPTLYGAPYRQPLASPAWEDGVYLTRDGLTLYTDYFPADVLKAVMDKATPVKTYLYRRGREIGQDFSNPIAQPFPWIHGDIAYATRASPTEPFSEWRLTERRDKFFNLGAPQGILNPQNPQRFDYFVYTSDAQSHTTIMLLRDTDRSLAGEGNPLPANVDNPRYREDNPHLERGDPNNPRKLVLMFDSEDWPGKGQHDIWYTLSEDEGASWSDPKAVASINTENDEQQPHLYFDGAHWWLYYAATNPADHKLAIYRARQSKPDDWSTWLNKELVVSAGTALGVGEPTLTARGDLSFVAVTQNPQGTATDQLDSDPWLMPTIVIQPSPENYPPATAQYPAQPPPASLSKQGCCSPPARTDGHRHHKSRPRRNKLSPPH